MFNLNKRRTRLRLVTLIMSIPGSIRSGGYDATSKGSKVESSSGFSSCRDDCSDCSSLAFGEGTGVIPGSVCRLCVIMFDVVEDDGGVSVCIEFFGWLSVVPLLPVPLLLPLLFIRKDDKRFEMPADIVCDIAGA
jgi:hypothetical protein